MPHIKPVEECKTVRERVKNGHIDNDNAVDKPELIAAAASPDNSSLDLPSSNDNESAPNKDSVMSTSDQRKFDRERTRRRAFRKPCRMVY